MFDTIHNHYHQFDDKHIVKLLKQIAMTNEEAIAKLDVQATQISKIQTEVQALIDAAQNQGNVSPELEAAINRTTSALQGLDDLNPDAPADGGTGGEQG